MINKVLIRCNYKRISLGQGLIGLSYSISTGHHLNSVMMGGGELFGDLKIILLWVA